MTDQGARLILRRPIDPGRDHLLWGAAGRDGVTLLVGAEREGLPDTVIAACDRAARIPIASDSLNAAMAATVALYEMTRRPYSCPARANDTVPAS